MVKWFGWFGAYGKRKRKTLHLTPQNDPKPPFRFYALMFLPPPDSNNLGAKSLTHGSLGLILDANCIAAQDPAVKSGYTSCTLCVQL